MMRTFRRSDQWTFRSPEVLVAALAFLVAGAAAAWIVRPLHFGTVGYDAAASVLYFDRIASGRHLEAFVGTTPKAWLTFAYGLVHGLVADWRIVTWLAIAAYAAGIAAATALAYRVAGAGRSGLAAAGFAAVGLVGSSELLLDVDLAYAVSWALLWWALAGLLVTGRRPRYALAGIVLAIGGLARFETFLVVGLGAALLAIGAVVLSRQGRSLAPVRARLPILLGLLGLPLQAIHDWLLTGDPLYTENLPVLASKGLPLVGVSGAVRFVGDHYAPEPILVLLALLGITILAMRRQWDVAAGLLAIGPGVAAFLVFLGFRGIYISARYIAPVDLGLIFAAAVGLSSIRAPALRQLARAGTRAPGAEPAAGVLLSVAAGALVALAVVRPFGPFDRVTMSTVGVNGRVHGDLDRATPRLAALLRETAGTTPAGPVASGSPTTPMGARAVVLAPVLTVPQLAVDLGLSLSAIGPTSGAAVATDGSYPSPGQLVFHDIDRDNPPQAFRVFEVERTTRAGAITIEPIVVDPGHRFWIDRIGR